MTRFSVLVLSCGAALGLASCETGTTGAGSGNLGPDPLGHRPGPRGFRTVVVDAGHGGKDSGAVSRRNGLVEKTLTLDVAQRLRADLRGRFHVIMTRDSDTFVSLDDRVRIADSNEKAILVSIHFNECRSSCAGPETYYWRVDSYTLAKRVQQNLSALATRHNSRGLVRRRLRLTRNPVIPCILVEGGYISSPTEAKSLSDPGYRTRIAQAVASAIREEAAEGDGDLGPLPSPINAPLSRDSDRRDRW